MDFPLTTILIITYKRLPELTRTIDALMKHIQYPKDRLQWVVSDDSSGDGYEESFRSQKRFQSLNLTWLTTPRNLGWGAHVNWAMRQIKTEYILFCEDDMVLMQKLDLRVGVSLLEVRQNIGYLRYRGIAGEHMIAHLFEADIKSYLPDYQQGVGLFGKASYFQLDNASHALWIYTNGLHLKRRSFHAFYGEYRTDLTLGETETEFAHRVKDAMRDRWMEGAPALAILPEFVPNWLDHIGKSYQGTEFDIRHTDVLLPEVEHK